MKAKQQMRDGLADLKRARQRAGAIVRAFDVAIASARLSDDDLRRLEEEEWQEALDAAEDKANNPKAISLREQVREAWPEGQRRKRPLWAHFKLKRGR